MMKFDVKFDLSGIKKMEQRVRKDMVPRAAGFVHQRHTLYYEKVKAGSGSSAFWDPGCPSNDPWASTGSE